MKPPQFHGGLNPLKDEAWVLGIEKLFQVVPCLETQKALLATFTLKDEVKRWWMLICESNKDIGWARFLEIFYNKYFPQCVRDRKVSEFMELKQNNMTVAEYEAKFTKVARFAPHMVDTDYKKLRHFERGLRDDILEKVNVLKLETYIEVLDQAIISEASIAKQTKSSTDWKSKKQGFFSKKRFSKKQNTGSSSTSNSSRDTSPMCNKCGKKHRGVCYCVLGACFKCGKIGHMARDCNQSNGKLATSSTALIPKLGNTMRPTTTGDTVRQGRVFVIVPGDMWNTKAVVSELNSIPIISVFPDVLPDELPGELIDREIEFTIEVVPSTQPISKILYRMATAEIKELKEQLLNLHP
ncbi:uncharacterized protein LOC114315649 [Camellia sinensis]|uniref:uncharacterized protein LOC114315649 n=1 Tax=Camellia sinensis TaxID=4442 RepID=UPI001036CF4B|nr:uncharacterized protein LOC114315649 [Camellia sinensis]